MPTPPLHPACAAYPPLPDDELLKLAEDIAANGLRDTIVMLVGTVLDGRCRWDACEMAEVEPRTREFGSEPTDGTNPVRYVLSKNHHRRHMSHDERAFAAEAIAKLMHGTNQYATKEDTSNEVSTSIAQKEAAAAFDVSLPSLQDARAIRTHAPELENDVRSGKTSLRAAATAARKRSPAARKGKPGKKGKQPKPPTRPIGQVLLERAAKAAAVPELTPEEKGYPPPELESLQHPDYPPGTTYAQAWRIENGRVSLWSLTRREQIQLTSAFQEVVGQLAQLTPEEWPAAVLIDKLDDQQRNLIMFGLRKVLTPLTPLLRAYEAALSREK